MHPPLSALMMEPEAFILLIQWSTSELHTKLGRTGLALWMESDLDTENTVIYTVETIVSIGSEESFLIISNK